MRSFIAAVAFVFVGGNAFAQSSSPQGASPTPLWRTETVHLAADMARIAGCLAEKRLDDERHCIGVVQRACYESVEEPLASSGSYMRRCGWRAIAAWEDTLTETRARFAAEADAVSAAAEETAHRAWRAYLDANVRARAAIYEGGTLSAQVAGDVRARMIAERVLELRADLALRADEQ